MAVGALVLVETSLAGNLGAAFRAAANFGVPRVELVRPRVAPQDDEVRRWACGAEDHLELGTFERFEDAVGPYRTLVGTASGRGRSNLPVVAPQTAFATLAARGLDAAALVFGNETSGLARRHLDRCDLVVRIPTDEAFPVLNLAQTIAVLLGFLALQAAPPDGEAPPPAEAAAVDGLMAHLEAALTDIGFMDPLNPDRILRKLRRLFGRAGITTNEVEILRGVCRQMQWAAKRPSGD
ncbi:MAG TPA: TrmH family RNA methyltransferase [Methylomirabilota bacterium]|nr:TrmH family RNA methyltransferase [Methylomirabilota bacterium]